jgi:hypothetical protein
LSAVAVFFYGLYASNSRKAYRGAARTGVRDVRVVHFLLVVGRLNPGPVSLAEGVSWSGRVP